MTWFGPIKSYNKLHSNAWLPVQAYTIYETNKLPDDNAASSATISGTYILWHSPDCSQWKTKCNWIEANVMKRKGKKNEKLFEPIVSVIIIVGVNKRPSQDLFFYAQFWLLICRHVEQCLEFRFDAVALRIGWRCQSCAFISLLSIT